MKMSYHWQILLKGEAILYHFNFVPKPDTNYHTPVLKAMLVKFRTFEWESKSEVNQGIILSTLGSSKKKWIQGEADFYIEHIN